VDGVVLDVLEELVSMIAVKFKSWAARRWNSDCNSFIARRKSLLEMKVVE
jgi:hypothetical protein